LSDQALKLWSVSAKRSCKKCHSGCPFTLLQFTDLTCSLGEPGPLLSRHYRTLAPRPPGFSQSPPAARRLRTGRRSAIPLTTPSSCSQPPPPQPTTQVKKPVRGTECRDPAPAARAPVRSGGGCQRGPTGPAFAAGGQRRQPAAGERSTPTKPAHARRTGTRQHRPAPCRGGALPCPSRLPPACPPGPAPGPAPATHRPPPAPRVSRPRWQGPTSHARCGRSLAGASVAARDAPRGRGRATGSGAAPREPTEPGDLQARLRRAAPAPGHGRCPAGLVCVASLSLRGGFGGLKNVPTEDVPQRERRERRPAGKLTEG